MKTRKEFRKPLDNLEKLRAIEKRKRVVITASLGVAQRLNECGSCGGGLYGDQKKYCSEKCFIESRPNCLFCGIKIIDKKGLKRTYCSKICARKCPILKARIYSKTSGHLNVNWKGPVEITCHCCKKVSLKSRDHTPTHCSRKCAYKCPSRNETLRKKMLGPLGPNWKGYYGKITLSALHRWVETRFPKPNLCVECKSKPPRDLANKGVYNRDLENWEWLCRRCHMTKDGRLEKFHKRNLLRAGVTSR